VLLSQKIKKFKGLSNIIPKARGVFYFWILFQLFSTIITAPAFCGDRPFNNTANWGGTGLMEIPTARVLEDGVMRMGFAQANPYRWFTGGMGIFPGLEFSGRYTELEGIPSGLGSLYGDYKDKAFDLKYQLLPESRRFPAIAMGLHDFHGTKLYPAEYLVLSRQFFPFDFTIGIGRKRLKGAVSLPFTDDMGVFGGMEWALSKYVHVLVEYNPVEYEKDIPPRAVPEGAASPLNIGLRFKILPGIDLGISYQRGDTLGLMGHIQAKLGQPILPKRPDPPSWGAVERRAFDEKDGEWLIKDIQKLIQEAGFQDVSVYTDAITLVAEFENIKYLSNQKAAGRVLRILLFHSPPDTKKLAVILKRQHIPFLRVSVRPYHLEKYLLGKISEEIFRQLVEVETATDNIDFSDDVLYKTEEENKFDYNFGIKPDFETFLNDPSGIFKYRVGIKPYVITTLWKGGTAYARYDIPFYSNISSSNIPPPDAVRSDSWKYLDVNYSFDLLMFDQVFRLSEKTFGRLSCGYFERMYAGVGGEVLTFLGDGTFGIGVEGDWVRKREPGTHFKLMDFERYTILGNFYYYLQGFDVNLKAQYGRFLAGDVGWKFFLSREYDTGLVVGAWYSFTDTDDFKDSFNRGYHEKGVFVSLPVRMFSNYETNRKYHYSFSPWTRDVAAAVSHWQDLYGLSADLMPARFKSGIGKIKD